MPDFVSRRALTAAAVLLTVIAMLRIAATYRVFAQTVDEPIHIAAGHQWLTEGRYDLDVEHPPLPRILFALDAYFTGAKVNLPDDRVTRGNTILYRNDQYLRNLAAARAGNLPWLVLALLFAFLWARRLAGPVAGVIAIALLGALPPVLAHAGLATTDMSVTASVIGALWFFQLWLDEPSWRRTLLLGCAIGIGCISKFSFLLYFPLGAVCASVPRFLGSAGRRGREAPDSPEAPRHRGTEAPFGRRIAELAGAGALAFLLIWAAYRFERGLLYRTAMVAMPPGTIEHSAAAYSEVPGYEWIRPDLLGRYHHYATNIAGRQGYHGVDFVDWAKAAGFPSPRAGRSGRDTMQGAPPLPPVTAGERFWEPFRRLDHRIRRFVPLPAITFFAGVEYVRMHAAGGHAGYLFGVRNETGWWYYFPVVFFFKTPLAFLILSIAGTAILARRREWFAWVAPLMLASAMTTRINIGVRHVLPMYPLLAVAAAVAVVVLWSRWRIAIAVLLAWYFIAGAIAHPDYLAYFNEAAGREPVRIAADSNLDWGQDLLRLADYARRNRLEPLYLSYFGSTPFEAHIPWAKVLPAGECTPGWVAVSDTRRVMNKDGRYNWLRPHRPVAKIGASIRLYRIPESACSGATLDPRGQH